MSLIYLKINIDIATIAMLWTFSCRQTQYYVNATIVMNWIFINTKPFSLNNCLFIFIYNKPFSFYLILLLFLFLFNSIIIIIIDLATFLKHFALYRLYIYQLLHLVNSLFLLQKIIVHALWYLISLLTSPFQNI